MRRSVWIQLIILSFAFFENEINAQENNKDSISFSWETYDFGIVERGRTVYCHLTVSNNSDTVILLDTIINECSCLKIKSKTKIIKPFQSIVLEFCWNTSKKKEGENCL